MHVLSRMYVCVCVASLLVLVALVEGRRRCDIEYPASRDPVLSMRSVANSRVYTHSSSRDSRGTC